MLCMRAHRHEGDLQLLLTMGFKKNSRIKGLDTVTDFFVWRLI